MSTAETIFNGTLGYLIATTGVYLLCAFIDRLRRGRWPWE